MSNIIKYDIIKPLLGGILMEVKDIYIKKGNDFDSVDFWVKGNNEMFSFDSFDDKQNM